MIKYAGIGSRKTPNYINLETSSTKWEEFKKEALK